MWCFSFYYLHKEEIKRKVNAKQNEGNKEDLKREKKTVGLINKLKKTSWVRLFVAMLALQESLLILMLNEANDEMEIYPV
jgi:hypothetical protein